METETAFILNARKMQLKCPGDIMRKEVFEYCVNSQPILKVACMNDRTTFRSAKTNKKQDKN